MCKKIVTRKHILTDEALEPPSSYLLSSYPLRLIGKKNVYKYIYSFNTHFKYMECHGNAGLSFKTIKSKQIGDFLSLYIYISKLTFYFLH